MKYFRNIKSFADLKAQFRVLAMANHPDVGGDPETMKEINVEYDALFPIWKDRQEKKTGDKVSETASSTRRHFYTQNGWVGSNYDSSLSLKEIAAIIREYVKEKYPTFRFSIRTHYASTCQELMISLTQAPFEVEKKASELSDDDLHDLWGYITRHGANRIFTDINSRMPNAPSDPTNKEIAEAYANGKLYKILREDVQAMFDDIDSLVKSYNYDDSDGMIDYFDTNFYYFGVSVDHSKFKVVEKKARIPQQKNEVAEPETKDASVEIGDTGYTVEKTKHTKTGETIYVVKFTEKLSRDEYLDKKQKMKDIGGYYSRFVHGFVFRNDPSDGLRSA